MRRRSGIAAASAAAVLVLVLASGGGALALGDAVGAGPAGAVAAAATQPVNVEFAAFAPTQLDVLPGETVAWTNVSPRVHTVTSDTGAFGTDALPSGGVFAQRFDTPGAFAYHCAIHPEMTGEVDVRRVILGPLPTAAVPLGQRVAVSGRAADPSRPVELQRSRAGGGFATVATASPAPDGSWSATVTADATADYRAVAGGDVSETRRLLVSVRRVRLRATPHGVTVTVTPPAPYAHILLQLDLRERFGWWPVARARLDYLSHAAFPVHRPARVRALLVAKDGWTPLAASPVVVLGQVTDTRVAPRLRLRSLLGGSVGLNRRSRSNPTLVID